MSHRTGTRSRSRARCLLLLVVLGTGCQRELAPTPNVLLLQDDGRGGGVRSFDAVPDALRTPEVNLLFATDRRPIEATAERSFSFGHERSESLDFGTCEVQIGDGLSWDDVVAASTTREREFPVPVTVGLIRIDGAFPETPARLEYRDGDWRESEAYVVERDEARAALHAQLRRRLAVTPRKEVMIYVHGVMTTFDEAAIHLAELWHFTGRIGVPLLYSWPAGKPGLLRAYNTDRESGEFTVFHLRELLEAVADCPEVERVNVIAHSRGTGILLTALRELVIGSRARGENPKDRYKLHHVILAAPDIDARVSLQRTGPDQIFRIWHRVALYVAQDDTALGFAEWLFSSPYRVGRLHPDEVDEKIDGLLSIGGRDGEVIESRISSDFLGHKYFVESPATMSDLILTLRDNRPVGAEHGRPLEEVRPHWYVLRDDYPETRPQ